jgi:hypothetical protein
MSRRSIFVQCRSDVSARIKSRVTLGARRREPAGLDGVLVLFAMTVEARAQNIENGVGVVCDSPQQVEQLIVLRTDLNSAVEEINAQNNSRGPALRCSRGRCQLPRTGPRQIPDCLGSVLVAARRDEAIEVYDQIVVDSDGHASHGVGSFLRVPTYKAYSIRPRHCRFVM